MKNIKEKENALKERQTKLTNKSETKQLVKDFK
jgi:hypothetical protein